jgi:hypothetical protein
MTEHAPDRHSVILGSNASSRRRHRIDSDMVSECVRECRSEVRTPELARPLAQLRRLLHLHNELRREEHDLRKAHLGLLVEAGWHLEKLREIEATLVSKSGDDAGDRGGEHSGEGEAAAAAGADEQLSRTLQRILLEESPGFKRVSSALQPVAPHAAAQLQG